MYSTVPIFLSFSLMMGRVFEDMAARSAGVVLSRKRSGAFGTMVMSMMTTAHSF